MSIRNFVYNSGSVAKLLVWRWRTVNSEDVKKPAGETCIICDTEKVKGIHLYTSFVCTDCETDMIQTETEDPKYAYYVDKLRRVKTPPLYS
ncbi:hypothetical protein RKD52_000059 [Metabacillus sp. SLBN-84]